MTQIKVQQLRSPMPSFVLHPRVHECAKSMMLARHALPALLTLLVSSVSSSLFADEQVNYSTQIKPVLIERCVACHGALKQEGGLRLDTAALAIKGGESGAAIMPGDADASLLLKRVTASDESERMPPGRRTVETSSRLRPCGTGLLRRRRPGGRTARARSARSLGFQDSSRARGSAG